MTTTTSRTRRPVAVLAAALLTLALTACGSGEEEPGVASAGGASSSDTRDEAGSAEDQQLAYTRCLRENGADITDGDGEGMGVVTDSDPALDAAIEACADLAPSGDDIGTLTPAELEMLRTFAACMREQGIDMPDPDPETGMGTPQGEVDQDAMQAGFAVCQEHLDFGAGS